CRRASSSILAFPRCLPHFGSNWACGLFPKQGRWTRSWLSRSKGRRRIDMKTLPVFLLIAAVLVAQSEKKKLTFDVVSIKPNNSGDIRRMIQPMPPARFTTSNASLRQLIVAAYVPNAGPLSNPEITGLPGWATNDRYDVQAQPEAGFTPTKEQGMEMLQSMLED